MILAVALGVMAGTAVLTGALLVGDSMRGSLRDLTLDRLGNIDDVLLARQFFGTQSVHDLAADPEFAQSILPPRTRLSCCTACLEVADVKNPRRAGRVNVIGCDSLNLDLPHRLRRRKRFIC